MNSDSPSRIGPADLTKEQLRQLFQIVEGGGVPMLVGKNGERIALPSALNEVLVQILEAMKRQEAVFLMHENEAFTTQAAANFLGVSRQFFVRLLEEGKLPYHFVGTHRRVFFKDLLSYQKERSEFRRSRLDKMTQEVVDAGLDEVIVDLSRPE